MLVTSNSSNNNNNIQGWETKLSLALGNYETNSEKIQLLTLIPDVYSKNKILHTFPEVTMHMINEKRK